MLEFTVQFEFWNKNFFATVLEVPGDEINIGTPGTLVSFLEFFTNLLVVEEFDGLGGHANRDVATGVAPMFAIDNDIKRIEVGGFEARVQNVVELKGSERAGEIVEVAVWKNGKGDILATF